MPCQSTIISNTSQSFIGLIREAHTSLSDIQNTQRAKEVLAQGIPPRQGIEKTPEQEMKERALQVPFHMHINLVGVHSFRLVLH